MGWTALGLFEAFQELSTFWFSVLVKPVKPVTVLSVPPLLVGQSFCLICDNSF